MTAFRIVNRIESYCVRSAFERSRDPVEFKRRYHAGEAIQARLRRPKVVQANILPLRKRGAK